MLLAKLALLENSDFSSQKIRFYPLNFVKNKLVLKSTKFGSKCEAIGLSCFMRTRHFGKSRVAERGAEGALYPRASGSRGPHNWITFMFGLQEML